MGRCRMNIKEIVDSQEIERILREISFEKKRFFEILEKARLKTGLSLEEVGALITADKKHLDLILQTAGNIRNEIYGNRMVLFAPLYWSNYCINRCAYCSFQSQNRQTKRVKLGLEDIKSETLALLSMGHKRTLLECGEDKKNNPLDYLLEVINTIYEVVNPKGDQIRRVNVNIAATTVHNYKKLADVNIGTYSLFQETYHQATYEKIHPQGTPKADFKRQIFAMNRAVEGGLADLGLGVLYGLYDWRFEILAVISHAQYLDKNFGIGPHTISVPRLCPAKGINFIPPYPVSDEDFLKIIALIRIAVPYTGMVISTRERPEIRLKAFKIGISQASAGSSTTPGGYNRLNKGGRVLSQFSLNDHRTIDEVTRELLENGFIPSHCTACEYKARMGKYFMPFARSGKIKEFCHPNALITLKEYLKNYASDKTRVLGEEVIKRESQSLPPRKRLLLNEWLKRLDEGETEYFYV